MLGNELLVRSISLAFISFDLVRDPLRTNRTPQVRISNVEIIRIQVSLGLDHLLRVFVYYRQRLRVINDTVANVAEVLQLVLEYPRRGLIALGGKPDYPAIITRYLAASGLHEHGFSTRLAAEHPQLVNHDTAGLLARYRISVSRHHL